MASIEELLNQLKTQIEENFIEDENKENAISILLFLRDFIEVSMNSPNACDLECDNCQASPLCCKVCGTPVFIQSSMP